MKAIPFVLISIGSAAVGLWVLLANAVLLAVFLHCIAATAGLVACHGLQPVGRRNGLFDYAICFGLPFVGGVFCCFCLLDEKSTQSKGVLEDFAQYVNASDRLAGDWSPPDAVRYDPHPESLESLLDIIRSGASVDDKRKAIESLAQIETPRAVEILRIALSNHSTEIRFYAASVLSQMEERLSQRLAALEQDVTRGRRKDSAVEFDLARSYFDYAYYGLVEGYRRERYIRKAIDLSRSTLRNGGRPDAWVLIGRALLYLGRYGEAEAAFDRFIEHEPNDVKGYLWRAESRFYQSDYAGLLEDCSMAEQCGIIPTRMEAVVEEWRMERYRETQAS